MAFPWGAGLLLYTDGVTEARDAAGTFCDPAGRLTSPCRRTPEELLATVTADVHRRTRGQAADGMALLVLAHTTGPGPTRPNPGDAL
ncbi:SpoIIE family protein phosphatase [Streptomyces sp. NPDC003374]